MINPTVYRQSRLGRVNEAMKAAFMAGKRIFVLITKDFSIGVDLVKMQSILPLIKSTDKDPETGTNCMSNYEFVDNDSFLEASTKISGSASRIYLYSGEKFPKASVKTYVDRVQGFSSLGGNDPAKHILTNSIIIVLTPSMPTDIPASVDAYVEFIDVPYVDENEFDELVSLWLKEKEGVPVQVDLNGFSKIADKSYLTSLYHNMRGLIPTEIISLLTALKVKYGKVYFDTSEKGSEKEFLRLLSEIRKDAERIISKASALSLKDTTSARQPAGLKKIEQWLKENGDRVCHPENYGREYAMQPPGGIIVSGVPGTGKSMMAAFIAKYLGRTLVRLDMGDAMGKYVGDSEKGLNDALRAVEALAPCVMHIDEIEKAMQGGHEVTTRMIGKFLTWMQEKTDRGLSIFVFCTSNDLSRMPPEMFRSGRFAEKYSLFMPSAKECGEIFESHIKAQCRDYLKYHGGDKATRQLFDDHSITAATFVAILNSPICSPEPLKESDKKFSRTNKFFTGADIASVIEKAKGIYINERHSSTGGYVFDTEPFIECLKKAVRDSRTYGETNLDDIVKCFAQLKKNNFFSATEDEVMPYRGYDEVRYHSECRRQRKDSEITPELYRLDDEANFLKGKCRYDRQLYISLRNAINHLAEKLVQ